MKRSWGKTAGLCALMLFLLAAAACTQKQAGRLETVDIPSVVLGKSIRSFVYLPYGYDAEKTYPAVYYLASGGGSAYTVVNQFAVAEAADALIAEGAIQPMIIVALGIDFSFGMNTADEPGSAVFESEAVYTFAQGRYEDYITQEAIPYIDSRYATRQEKAYRYIGGYSMGGFAALHVGFRNPELFSKIGGHSPTLFLDTYVTPEIHQWLFPNDTQRERRDPMLLAQTQDLKDVQVYLDTGAADVNREACEALARLLMQRGTDAVFWELPGSHGYEYCREHMPEYLLFYGTAPAADTGYGQQEGST